MIHGFRITILTGIFPNLGACFSRIELVFSTFSCCWRSRGTVSRVRIQQARNGRFHCMIFDIVQGSAFLAWKVGRNSRLNFFRGIRIVWTFRYFFLLNGETATKQGHFTKETGFVARLRSAVTSVKGTGRLLYIVCCWFPISVYRYHVLLFAVTIHWTATEHPRWEEQQTHQIEMASGDHSGSITYSFKCGLRGLHVYKEVWSPIVGEQLKCCYERNNCYDRYAITVTKCLRCRLGNSTVGHLPREISRATRSGRSGLFVLKSSTRTTEDLP